MGCIIQSNNLYEMVSFETVATLRKEVRRTSLKSPPPSHYGLRQIVQKSPHWLYPPFLPSTTAKLFSTVRSSLSRLLSMVGVMV